MNSVVETLFGLFGGLALFLFGMNMMSEGLQKAAGEKMKSILAVLTKNPIMGVLAGTLVTAVLQSSSATTVMVIGFVSAGLMSLPQAISVVLGANIGTTMTAQLMAFKISDYIWPIVFIGFFIQFLAKKEQVKNIGQTIFAFGLLFVGIETMGDVMKPLASSPVFTNMIAQVSHIPVLGVCVGALMTLVVQSSSATIAVLQNFASQAGPDGVSSVLGLTGAIPILFGDNIGTTITAILASIGQSKSAKRTAIAHSIFNISGSFVFIWFIPWFAKFVEWISPKGAELDIISRQIANAHTTFNIVCTLLWLPFISVLVKIVKFIIPGEDAIAVESQASKYLDYNLLNQPVFAVKMVTEELREISESMKMTLLNLTKAMEQNSKEPLMAVEGVCADIERQNDETMKYMSALFAEGALTEKQASYVSDLMMVMENIDHIEKRCLEMVSLIGEKINHKDSYSEEADKDIREDMQMVMETYDMVLGYLHGDREEVVANLENRKLKMTKQRHKARKRNIKRVKENHCQKASADSFNQMLFCLERITNDCFNLLENDISSFQVDTVEEEAMQNQPITVAAQTVSSVTI